MTGSVDAASTGLIQLDVWQVRLASGEVRMMTVDELDAAFDQGIVDERTLVLRSGMTAWATLAEVAGLESPEPPPVSLSPPQSVAPVAYEPPRAAFATDEEVPFAPRRRAGKMVLGAIGAVASIALLAGAAVAGMQAAKAVPMADGRAAAMAPATPDAPEPPKALEPPKAPAAERAPAAPVVTAEAPKPAPAAAGAAAAKPSFTADSLPDAPAAKSAKGKARASKAKGKRSTKPRKAKRSGKR